MKKQKQITKLNLFHNFMDYQIRMMNGDSYNVTESEAMGLLSGEAKGIVGINSLRGGLNMSSVSSILPLDKVDRSNMKTGRLHDGTRVIKRFGEWRDAYNPEVQLDLSYYPEIAADQVMSDDEYEAAKQKLLTQ